MAGKCETYVDLAELGAGGYGDPVSYAWPTTRALRGARGLCGTQSGGVPLGADASRKGDGAFEWLAGVACPLLAGGKARGIEPVLAILCTCGGSGT